MVTARVTQSFSVRPVVPHRLGLGLRLTYTPPPERSEVHKRAEVQAERKLFSPMYVLSTQTWLAQIVEMLHTALLLHDDAVDESALRRGSLSAPAAFGSKMSVLGGDFVLGRAAGALARLGDEEVTDLITRALLDVMEGEILQMNEVEMRGKGGEGEGHVGRCREAWNVYLQKTYLKRASLMAKGASAAVTLGGCKEGDVWREIAYAYGRNLGMAFQVRNFYGCSRELFIIFQLVDDILDYDSQSGMLGKPGGADLQLGLATGPALYAWDEHLEMEELIQRKFEKPGDVERVSVGCSAQASWIYFILRVRDYVKLLDGAQCDADYRE